MLCMYYVVFDTLRQVSSKGKFESQCVLFLQKVELGPPCVNRARPNPFILGMFICPGVCCFFICIVDTNTIQFFQPFLRVRRTNPKFTASTIEVVVVHFTLPAKTSHISFSSHSWMNEGQISRNFFSVIFS